MRKVVLTLQEQYKYNIIKKLVETNGNKETARIKLGFKDIRQIYRLINGYKEFGKEFFVHGNRGRKPVHALTKDFKDQIELLYTSKYFDCTYTQFTEYLAERENIFLSVAEVGQILREKYILSPKSRKVTKKNIKKLLNAKKEKAKSKKEIAKLQSQIVALEDAHPRQPRCINFGEEIQTDACIHLWFGKTKTALHAAIDDATGHVVAAYFDTQETLNGYYNIYYQILINYGIPYLFKTDKRTVFEYNKKGTTSDEDNTFTQFAYACNQLGTAISCSSVPEFKPRIERLFEAFQLRLIPELRLANITTIEEANAFLPSFLDKYNSKFALCINNTKSVFEKQPSEQKINLTLAVLSRRIVDTGHSICFKKKHYRTVNSVGTPIYFGKGTKCMVIEAFDKKLYATVEDSIFALEEIPEVQAYSENFDEVLPTEPKKIYIPKMTHPFKRASFEAFAQKQAIKMNQILEEAS
ncbi:ISNCY family transposase [Faecalibacillus intestinalis]|uniref:ISNCY family transposase n=1 Tax=Faecalibacillus intestinalis TaxID=1982626 RepID=UPI00399B2A08